MEGPNHELELDMSIWKAMGGPALHIPAQNSIVWYYPYLHAQACGAHIAGDALPNRILALVSDLHLRTNGIDVYAEFQLRFLHHIDPTHEEEVIRQIGGGDVGPMEDGVIAFTKRIPFGEVAIGSSCHLPSELAEALFPPLDLGMSQNLNYVNLFGQQRLFEHRRNPNGVHYLGPAELWTAFRNDHEPEANELLVMARRGNDYRAGLRRRRGRSARPTPQEMAVVEAGYIDGGGQPLRVRYYPNVSREYVVSATAMWRGNRLRVGEMVEFVKAGNHGNAVVMNGQVVSRAGVDYAALISVITNHGGWIGPAWKVRPA